MPELPDIVIYIEQLQARVLHKPVQGIRLLNPFLLRSVTPPLQEAVGRKVVALHRVGNRIVIGLEGDLFVAVHLMIARRVQWRSTAGVKTGRNCVAVFSFPSGDLLLTEAGSKKRASLHLVRGAAELQALGRGGVEVLDCDLSGFRAALVRENHTLKRALTDPRLFSGIGNAYSDEILHRARLSPVALTQRLTDEAVERLFAASQATLREWVERLRTEAGKVFPEKVTAFRPGMYVHGRFRSLARPAARPCSASRTPKTRRTIAPAAKPEENSWPTGLFAPAQDRLAAHSRRDGESESSGEGASQQFSTKVPMNEVETSIENSEGDAGHLFALTSF